MRAVSLMDLEWAMRATLAGRDPAALIARAHIEDKLRKRGLTRQPGSLGSVAGRGPLSETPRRYGPPEIAALSAVVAALAQWRRAGQGR